MKILWGIYVIIGLGAFIISYLLESFVFSRISSMFLMSYSLAAVFEGAKIMTIVIPRFQTGKNKNKIPSGFKAGVTMFQFILFFVSIWCSIALLATFLDKPNLKNIMLADKELIENNYQENKKSLLTEFDKTLTNLANEVQTKCKSRYARLAAYYEPRIEKEEKLRDFEFTNIINNIRKGARWHEHDRKINILTTDYQKKENELQIAETEEFKSRKKDIKEYFSSMLNELRAKKDNSLANLKKHLSNDSRACNQMILSLIGTLHKGLNVKISYDLLIILFAIITALLLEGTIYVVFNYLTITHQEIFSMKNNQYLDEEKLKANAKTEMNKDNIRYELFKNRIKHQVRNIKDNVFTFKRNAHNG
ncbi:MAG: hypothetical protein U9P79_05690 [Candidatus Cloacimonadota bacterium]|nr:hypothetical protein [Candidatus Cloacimonadota bacterium]